MDTTQFSKVWGGFLFERFAFIDKSILFKSLVLDLPAVILEITGIIPDDPERFCPGKQKG